MIDIELKESKICAVFSVIIHFDILIMFLEIVRSYFDN